MFEWQEVRYCSCHQSEIVISFDNLDQNKLLTYHFKGAFFWKQSGYSHSGLGITEYTEYQIPKERIF